MPDQDLTFEEDDVIEMKWKFSSLNFSPRGVLKASSLGSPMWSQLLDKAGP